MAGQGGRDIIQINHQGASVPPCGCAVHQMGNQLEHGSGLFRTDIGIQEKFLQFLRAYQKQFAWYPPSYSQDVPDLLKAITGKDYTDWMNKYFWGTELPQWKP